MKLSFLPTILVLICGSWLLQQPTLAQSRCVVSIQMVNHNRYVYDTAEECGRFFHSAPWGNWGVSSNVGSRRDTDQFKGWREPCSQTKVQWNSCSERSRYRSPTYLNFPHLSAAYPYPSNGYPFSDPFAWNDAVPPYGSTYHADQYSPCGPNTYGSFQVSKPVAARVDVNNDGLFDAGGCAEMNGYKLNVQQNFMSVYELDTPDPDDLVESLYFPDVSVTLSCGTDACFAVGDNDYNGWIDDISKQFSQSYVWPTLYQDNTGVICSPSTPGVGCKKIDASIRVGHVAGYYTGL